MDIRKILSIQKNVDIQANLPDGVLFIGTNAIIQWANDVSHDLFRVDEGMLVSKSINDLLDNGYDLIKNSANTHKALIAKYAHDEEYFELTAREVEDGYVVSLRDSTQNYKRISNILEEQESSQKINSDKNCFLVKLANEFNSPIQSNIGFAQAIIDGMGGRVSDKQTKYANIIKKNSSDLLYFFSKLVELSQTEGGLIDNEEKRFNVVTVLDFIIKANKHMYQEKAINVEFTVDEKLKRNITQKEALFKMMVYNLLETLMREIEIGTINVSVSEADEEFLTARNIPVKSAVQISMSSNNITIIEAEMTTLFNPYAVVDSSNKRTISRALALGTVSNIAKDLGGVIWAEILPMKGLVFNIIIPRETSDNE